MSWTKLQCLQCMIFRGKCDGHCREVPKPHNLGPVAYDIDGKDQDSIIDEHIDLFDT